jgi:signal transduction histidine kinase
MKRRRGGSLCRNVLPIQLDKGVDMMNLENGITTQGFTQRRLPNLVTVGVLLVCLFFAVRSHRWFESSDNTNPKLAGIPALFEWALPFIIFGIVTYFLLSSQTKRQTRALVKALVQAQEATAERENQLRSLLDAIPECVIMKDGDGRWLVANEHTIRAFDLGAVDYRDKRGVDIKNYSSFYERMSTQCDQSDEYAWETGKPFHLEQTVIQGDGAPVLFETVKIPEFHPDGKRKRLVVIARNVTDRKRTDELIMKSEKLSIVGQLAAGVAHEIRNPLTAIRGFVQLLESTSDGNPDYFRIVLAELIRIESIISEFLLLAKPEAVHTQRADVKELLEQTITLLGPQAVLHNVHIDYTVHQTPLPIECEPNHLKQVFINLLKNAIEAMRSGGGVHVSIGIDAESILLQFVDHGCGISKERLERLGEPFYTTKERGTGVGLMVSHRIIENHKGTLTIHSEEGQGTSVEVRLPLHASHQQASDIQSSCS